MALSDFWEIKDHQQLEGQNILNVYHTKRILAGANATLVALAYIQWIMSPSLKPLQDSNLTRTTVDVRNLGDVTDFVSDDVSTHPGTRVGNYTSTFSAGGMRFVRTRTDMRNGYKRFAVGLETDGADGVWDAAFIADLQTLADNILSPWETTDTPGVDVCSFVILKRFCVVPGQSPCLKYRLPESSAEIDANHYVPVNSVIYNHVTSQVSRKHLT